MSDEEPQPSTSWSTVIAPATKKIKIEPPTNVDDERVRTELTQNFLAGKLSFMEYATQLEDDSDEEYVEMERDETETAAVVLETTPPKPLRRPRRPRNSLPPTLKGLMGEANLRCARGDTETAEKICLGIICEMASSPEPFQTLAQIYENDQPEKSLQCLLIAAHLIRNDVDLWIRLGTQSEELGDFKQALMCYTKAVAVGPTNLEGHIKKIKLLEMMNEKKLALRGYMRMLHFLTEEHSDLLLSVARTVAEQYQAENETAKAIDALEMAFSKCPTRITLEIVNIMLELLLIAKRYKRCLEILVQYCSIEVELVTQLYKVDEGNIEERLNIVSYTMADDLVVDLRIKFFLCVIHLKAFHLTESLLQPLLMEIDVEKYGDLYLDVAEALMSEGQHADALKLLVQLVKNKNFSMAAVWLRHAECLNACNMIEQAIDSYRTVMNLAPLHTEVRYPLSELYLKMAKPKKALAVLKQDETREELDAGLLFRRCKLLKATNNNDEFVKAMQLLVLRHSTTVRREEELYPMTIFTRVDRKYEAIEQLRITHEENPKDEFPVFRSPTKEPTTEEEYELFKECMEMVMKSKNYPLFQRLAFMALSSKKFFRAYKEEVELIAFQACLCNGDSVHGFNIIREFVERYSDYTRPWNLYNCMLQKSDDSRHQKFLMRLMDRKNIDVDVRIIYANNCLAAGSYMYAAIEYLQAYLREKNPLYALLIAVTYLQMACQKFADDTPQLMLQAMAFMDKYGELRGEDLRQEYYYNKARMFHQVGYLHLARKYYKMVLKCEAPLGLEQPEIFDLKKEAAFNLYQMYREAGAYDLARKVLYKYVVI